MNKAIKVVSRAVVLVAAAGLVSACSVTKEQLAAVEAKANNALSEARAAQGAATNALNVASQAAEAAKRAQSAADAAAACCSENTQKINNMFEKAMRK